LTVPRTAHAAGAGPRRSSKGVVHIVGIFAPDVAERDVGEARQRGIPQKPASRFPSLARQVLTRQQTCPRRAAGSRRI